MHDLIRGLLLKKFNNPILKELSDAAILDYPQKISFTTDSFVVNPLFFPGGDIGKLAVSGTINDLVVVGSEPQYLSVGLIIEEGLSSRILEKIIDSISWAAKKARVSVVTGDLKVVEKGACDKIFINTSGIGRLITRKKLSLKNIEAGDKVILSGNVAEHGLAVLAKRKDLDLGFNIQSDCAPLNGLIIPVLKKTHSIVFMRDPTRGGLATTLNEITENARYGIVMEEKKIPLSGKVKAACELLGLDPLYIANEGKAVIIARKNSAKKVLNLLKKHPLGRSAQIIGEVVSSPAGRVILKTVLGTERIVDMLTAEATPRIC